MKHVTGAVGIDHALARDRQRRQLADRAGLVIPEQAVFAHGDAADPAAAALEIVEHGVRRLVHLLAQPLGNDGDVDEFQQLMGIRSQAAAVERRQDAVLAAELGVMDCSIRLMAVDMQRAAALQIKHRKGVDILVVATAYDGALAVFRHDERQRGGVDLARMDRDSVFRAMS